MNIYIKYTLITYYCCITNPKATWLYMIAKEDCQTETEGGCEIAPIMISC